MKIKAIFALILALASFAALQPAAAAVTIELVPSQRVIIKITSDMTIDKIIARVYPGEETLWPQIKEKLIETNPGSSTVSTGTPRGSSLWEASVSMSRNTNWPRWLCASGKRRRARSWRRRRIPS